jgi:hypothetical protein
MFRVIDGTLSCTRVDRDPRTIDVQSKLDGKVALVTGAG